MQIRAVIGGTHHLETATTTPDTISKMAFFSPASLVLKTEARDPNPSRPSEPGVDFHRGQTSEHARRCAW